MASGSSRQILTGQVDHSLWLLKQKCSMGEDGVWLALTGFVIEQWKEYFKDLFNPSNASSIEETESEVDSAITAAEVSEMLRRCMVAELQGGWDLP